jgi:hydroxyacylglutathione hydrolase
MRFAAALILASACAGEASQPDDVVDAAAATDAPRDPETGLVPGTLEVAWMHGSLDCGQNADPELQLHAYNATTHVVRQNKCDTFEAPFVYVLLGANVAFVLDSGATTGPGLRDAVQRLAGARRIVVAHSHAHGDHVASDGRFAGQPNTTVIGRARAAVEQAFGIAPWPTGPGSLDLGGGRVLDVLGIPGHEATHIAVYDRETGLLLTGDTLYPGLLFITDWNEYRTSVKRLAAFAAAHPVAHVLGAHIEMTATPGVNYPYGTTFQPDEHVLQLGAEHLVELDAALDALGPAPPPNEVPHADFVISPQ